MESGFDTKALSYASSADNLGGLPNVFFSEPKMIKEEMHLLYCIL